MRGYLQAHQVQDDHQPRLHLRKLSSVQRMVVESAMNVNLQQMARTQMLKSFALKDFQ
jgi:hypothetical protein